MSTHPRTGRLRRAGIVIAGGALGLMVYACRAPTQVTIDVETPVVACTSLKSVVVVVAATADEAERRAAQHVYTAVVDETGCASASKVGTLVVTPATDRGAVVVVAGITKDASTCTPDNRYAGCVVARRAFSFIDYVGTRIPVAIDPACVDLPCDAQSTCVDEACRSSEVFCDDSGACLPPGEQPDGGITFVDAGAAGGDGGASGDGGSSSDGGPGSDAGPTACNVPCTTAEPRGPGCPGCQGGQVCCGNGSTLQCQATCPAPSTFCCLGQADCPGAQRCCRPKDGTSVRCLPAAECETVYCLPGEVCSGGDPCLPGAADVPSICL